jgi:hypothetical protein
VTGAINNKARVRDSEVFVIRTRVQVGLIIVLVAIVATQLWLNLKLSRENADLKIKFATADIARMNATSDLELAQSERDSCQAWAKCVLFHAANWPGACQK